MSALSIFRPNSRRRQTRQAIDMDAVARSFDEVQPDESDGKRRYRFLCGTTSVMPSGVWYSMAQVGQTVSFWQALRDLIWLAWMRYQAQRRGMAFQADDDTGETFFASVPINQ